MRTKLQLFRPGIVDAVPLPNALPSNRPRPHRKGLVGNRHQPLSPQHDKALFEKVVIVIPHRPPRVEDRVVEKCPVAVEVFGREHVPGGDLPTAAVDCVAPR